MTTMRGAVPARSLDMRERLGFVVEDGIGDRGSHGNVLNLLRCAVKYIIALLTP